MHREGDVIGRYTLLRRIAVGGMGEVFLANHRDGAGSGREVALKLVRPELSRDATFVQMLVDEAKISTSLAHRNIVSVFDFGEVSGAYYMAMEYVDGLTVEGLLHELETRGRRFDVHLALLVGIELCRALHHAHTVESGDGQPLHVVHRDVTPANLLISIHGDVKLTDFGIARAKCRLHQTQAGVLKGKLGYLAPEMARFEPIDARADLFCVGVVLYHLLAGVHPVGVVGMVEGMLRFERKQIVPPSVHNSALSRELDEIVLRALEPLQADRWQTAQDLRAALEGAIAIYARHDPTLARTVAELGRLVRDLRGTDVAPRPASLAPMFARFIPDAQAERRLSRALSASVPVVPRELAETEDVPAARAFDEDTTSRRAVLVMDAELAETAIRRDQLTLDPAPDSERLTPSSSSSDEEDTASSTVPQGASMPGPQVVEPELFTTAEDLRKTASGEEDTTAAHPRLTPVSRTPTTERRSEARALSSPRISYEDSSEQSVVAVPEAIPIVVGSPEEVAQPARRSSLAFVAGVALIFLVGAGAGALFMPSFRAKPIVRVTTTPPGATVRIDDNAIFGSTPMIIEVEPHVVHRLSIDAEGHRPVTRELEPADRGERHTIAVTLERLNPPSTIAAPGSEPRTPIRLEP